MSTRSGKRIHSSFHENILKPDLELGYKSEKKTRSRRLKENLEDINVTLLKSKKRENYVSFPTDDESVGDSAVIIEPELNATRSLRRNALKEQNTTVPDIATLDSTKEPKKLPRQTRRTKKFSENATEDILVTKNNEVTTLEAVEKPKHKKNKKKKEPLEQTMEEVAPVQTRKSKRKKKKSSSNSLIVEEINQNPMKNNSINQSNMSVDSFHSAAGSPQRLNTYEAIKEDPSNKTSDLETKLNSDRKSINLSNEKTNKSKKPKKKKPVNNTTLETDKATIDLDDIAQYKTKINKSDVKDSTIDKNDMVTTSGSGKNNKSSVKDITFDEDTIPKKRQSKRKCSIKDNNISLASNKDVNTTFEKDTEIVIDNECSQNGQFRKRKSSIKNNTLTFTQTDEINISHKRNSSIQDTNLIKTPTITETVKTNFDKDTEAGSTNTRKRKYSIKDTNLTFTPTSVNTTYEKDNEEQSTGTRKRKSSIKVNNLTLTQTTTEINTTFEKETKESANTRNRKSSVKDNNLTFTPTSINTTFEKDTEGTKSTSTENRKSLVKDNNLTVTPKIINDTFEKDTEIETTNTRKRKSSIKDTNLTFTPTSINTTFEKDTEGTKSTSTGNRRSLVKDNNLTFTPTIINNTFEKDTEIENTNTRKRKSSIKDTNLIFTSTSINTTFEKDTEGTKSTSTGNTKSLVKDNNLTFTPTIINNTFEKDTEIETTNTRKRKSSIKDTNLTFTPTSINTTYEKDTEGTKSTSTGNRKSLVKDDNLTFTPTITKEINTTFDKSDNSVICINTTFEKRNSNEVNKRKSIINSERLNNTYDKSPATETKEKSDLNNTFNKSKELKETTFEKDKKLDSTYDKSNSKSSLVTSDSSNNTIGNDISHVSITSDESSEKIMNTTPLLIESSMEDSQLHDDTKKPESPVKQPQTPLKREGTFTKESPVVESLPNKTPTKRMSLPSPGCTPYLSRSSNREKMVLNVTRSIEKGRRSSLYDVAPRQTKVMFCSPVNDPVVVKQQKRKVIKSNLKGSNKSFVFEESVSRPAPRKRSYTLSDADDARVKRKRLADDIQHSVDRLSRPRTSSASAKLEPSTPSKKHTTPSKSKPDAKVSRTKLPNFAALHQRQFDKMESLDECQERKAKRAKQLLTPTGTLNKLDRSAKGPSPEQQSQKDPKSQGTPAKRFHTQLPSIDSIKPGYTRFGFKLNMDANPFSIPSKNEQAKPKEIKPNGLTREPTLPSLVGGTSLRREAAKQIVLREKSFTGKRNVKRNENRTVIKGVRTNRRFELQMRMRNIE